MAIFTEKHWMRSAIFLYKMKNQNSFAEQKKLYFWQTNTGKILAQQNSKGFDAQDAD